MTGVLQDIPEGSGIALRSVHGKYLSAQPDGRAEWNRDHASTWEHFHLEKRQGSKIALKGAHGMYVSAQTNGTVQINRREAPSGGWEEFTVEDRGNDVVCLKSCHGKYLSAQQNGTAQWNRDHAPRGGWEDIQIEYQGSNSEIHDEEAMAASMPPSVTVSGAGSSEVNGTYVFKPGKHENRHWDTIAGHYQHNHYPEIFIAFQDCGTAHQRPEWNKWMIISKIGVLYAAHTGGKIGVPPRDGGWETVDSWGNPGAPGGKHPAPLVNSSRAALISGSPKKAATKIQERAPARRQESIEILEAVTVKPLRFKINNRPSSNDAWVGIYPLSASDQDHGEENKRWKWLRNIDVNNVSFPKQSEGDWSIRVFADGGHTLHERKDFTVKAEPLDPAAVQSIRKNARIALVIGTILFSIGLPLFIVGNITDGEDNLAMIIPGAIMFGVGAFVVVSASFVLISSRSKSYAETDKPAPTDSSYSIQLEDMSFWDGITEGSEDTRSYHDKLLEKMKYPDKEEIEQDIQSGKPLQKWYSHWLHDPVKSAEIAKALGLVVGGAGHDFEGSWGTKGLYAYRSGKYSGHAYFGTGGSDEDRLEPEDDDDKYRPWDRNDPKTPENIRKIWLEIEPRLARSYYLDSPNDD